ncbi:hypothetical protein ABIF86_001426 [Bradyrhizobium japonicum]
MGHWRQCSNGPIVSPGRRKLTSAPLLAGVLTRVHDDLVAKVEPRNDPAMPDGSKANGQWHLMTYEFHLKPGGGMAPKPLGVKAEEPA